MVKAGHTEHDLVMKMLNQIERSKMRKKGPTYLLYQESIETHIKYGRMNYLI